MKEFLVSRLGLPVLASEQGRSVDDLIIYVHLLMIALFAGWLAYFAYALFRFRRSRNQYRERRERACGRTIS